MGLDELVARFDPERMARGDVILEDSRLRHLSTAHLRGLPDEELVARVLPRSPRRNRPASWSPRWRRRCAASTRWPRPPTWSPASPASRRTARLPEMAAIRGRYPERLSEPEARELVDELRRAGVPLKEARLALTGRERGPELWAVLAALPRDEAMRRAA